MKRIIRFFLLGIMTLLPLSGCGRKDDNTIILRVNSWEEYIDEGEW